MPSEILIYLRYFPVSNQTENAFLGIAGNTRLQNADGG